MLDIAMIILLSSVAVAILTYGLGFSYTFAVTVCVIPILIGIGLAELFFIISRDDPLSPLKRPFPFNYYYRFAVISDFVIISAWSSLSVAILTYGIGFSFTLAITISVITVLVGIVLAELFSSSSILSPLKRIYRFRRDTDYEWEFDRA